MYKLVFFVPESHLEQVKTAVFATGAGQIGDYEQCCFETRGTGQFAGVKGSGTLLGVEDISTFPAKGFVTFAGTFSR